MVEVDSWASTTTPGHTTSKRIFVIIISMSLNVSEDHVHETFEWIKNYPELNRRFIKTVHSTS